MTRRPITAFRKLLKMTQREFAERMGVPLPSLKAIEGGKYGVSLRVAHRIYERTGISPAWLIDGNPKEPTTAAGKPYGVSGFIPCDGGTL